MRCTCSMIPPDLKIIKVGDSEVGIHDLRKILRKVYLLEIREESALKEELLKRVSEKNYIPESRKELYAEALLREYKDFANRQWPVKKSQESINKNRKKNSLSFFKRLFSFKSDKK